MRVLALQVIAGLFLSVSIGCGHVQLAAPPDAADAAALARYEHAMSPKTRRTMTTTTTYVDGLGLEVGRRVEKRTQLVLQSGAIVTWPEDLIPVVGADSGCGKLAREAGDERRLSEVFSNTAGVLALLSWPLAAVHPEQLVFPKFPVPPIACLAAAGGAGALFVTVFARKNDVDAARDRAFACYVHQFATVD